MTVAPPVVAATADVSYASSSRSSKPASSNWPPATSPPTSLNHRAATEPPAARGQEPARSRESGVRRIARVSERVPRERLSHARPENASRGDLQGSHLAVSAETSVAGPS